MHYAHVDIRHIIYTIYIYKYIKQLLSFVLCTIIYFVSVTIT